MKKRITDPVEQLKALLTLGDDDMLDADYPKALIDAELREAGGDPEQIGAEGEAFVKRLLAEKAAAASRKASRTQLRSAAKAMSSSPPARTAFSTLPPMRAKQPSDTGPLDDGE